MKSKTLRIISALLLSLFLSFISCEEAPTPVLFPWTHFYEPLSCEDPWDGNPGGELSALKTFYADEGIDILRVEFDVEPTSSNTFVTDQGCILYAGDTERIDIEVSEADSDKLDNLNHGWQAY